MARFLPSVDSWRFLSDHFVEALLLAIVVAFVGADVGEVSWTRCGAGDGFSQKLYVYPPEV